MSAPDTKISPPNHYDPLFPTILKPISHFLKLGLVYLTEDPVVSFWCYYYAASKGLSIDKTSIESKVYLSRILDWIELQKLKHKNVESINKSASGRSYMEKYAMDLVEEADFLDSARVYDKTLVKKYYSAGFICDTLQSFGELSEDMQNKMDFCKRRATYIHRCLGNKETPEPLNTDTTESIVDLHRDLELLEKTVPDVPQIEELVGENHETDTKIAEERPNVEGPNYERQYANNAQQIEKIIEAQKLTRQAASSLDYSDVATAKHFLREALAILDALSCPNVTSV